MLFPRFPSYFPLLLKKIIDANTAKSHYIRNYQSHIYNMETKSIDTAKTAGTILPIFGPRVQCGFKRRHCGNL